MLTYHDFQNEFLDCFRCSTPFVLIETSDPAQTITSLTTLLVESQQEWNSTFPILTWNLAAGCSPAIAESGAAQSLSEQAVSALQLHRVAPLAEVLLTLRSRLPDKSVFFLQNPHLFWKEGPGVIQALSNLRDTFKATSRLLVLLVPPATTVPPELAPDLVPLTEPLPTPEELAPLVRAMSEAASIPVPDGAALEEVTNRLLGLSRFGAEQALALAAKSTTGFDLPTLWRHNSRQLVRQAALESVTPSRHPIGGCRQVQSYLASLLHGKYAPRLIIWIDEMEKAFAGSGSESTGIKLELMGAMLTWMEETEAMGLLFVGVTGAAKSATAKSAGTVAGTPLMRFHLGRCLDKYVGESGHRLRRTLQSIEAVSQGRTLWIATCNSLDALPPELRRRFADGTFYFDLPTEEEKSEIWSIYEDHYGVGGARPPDRGWTGGEIRVCCRQADKLGLSLADAAAYIVPVSQSAPEQIALLRDTAHNRWLSAARAGVFRKEDVEYYSNYRQDETPASNAGRLLRRLQ